MGTGFRGIAGATIGALLGLGAAAPAPAQQSMPASVVISMIADTVDRQTGRVDPQCRGAGCDTECRLKFEITNRLGIPIDLFEATLVLTDRAGRPLRLKDGSLETGFSLRDLDSGEGVIELLDSRPLRNERDYVDLAHADSTIKDAKRAPLEGQVPCWEVGSVTPKAITLRAGSHALCIRISCVPMFTVRSMAVPRTALTPGS